MADEEKKEDKEKKTKDGKINPSNHVELNPILESFVDNILDGSEDLISDDEEFTYSDLLRAVIEDDLEDFEYMVGGYAEDLFDYVSDTIYDSDDEYEDDLDEAATPLTIGQRRRRAQVMRKYKSKIAAARRRARRRKASPDKLKARAKRKARDLVRKRFTQGQSYGDISASQKIQVDKRLSRVSPTVINRIAQRQLPKVRQAETQRMARLNQSYETIGELIEAVSDIDSLFESKFK